MKGKTDDSSHLRRHRPDAGLVDIKAFSILAHAVHIDNGDLQRAIVVHGRMREAALDGSVDGRPAHGPSRDRFVDQNPARDRDGLVRFAQNEIGGEDGLELERKRVGHSD